MRHTSTTLRALFATLVAAAAAGSVWAADPAPAPATQGKALAPRNKDGVEFKDGPG